LSHKVGKQCQKKLRRITSSEPLQAATIAENNWGVHQPFGKQLACFSFGQKPFVV
jgi:hypothetical protein